MGEIVETKRGEAIGPQGDHHAVAVLDAGAWRRHDARCHFACVRDDRMYARCSIWTESTPIYRQSAVGVIGHYAAADAEAAATVLNHAAGQLKRLGFRFAVGPMDGNTWRRYRLLTRRGSEPPFFLEPDNPDEWPDHFTAAGFCSIAGYFSALNDDLSITDPRVPEAMERLRESGVRIRVIDPSRFEEDL